MPVLSGYLLPHPPVIIPDVGGGREGEIRNTSESYDMAARKIAELEPEVLIVITPHSVSYADYFHISPGSGAKGSFKQFGAEQVRITAIYDNALAAAIAEEAERDGIPAGFLGERSKELDHGTMLPLYFINKRLSGYKIVRVALSGMPTLSHYQFGKCIAKAVERLGRRVVIIASGDLSHKLTADGPYGYAPEGERFDRELMDACGKADFLKFMTFDKGFCRAAAECGLGSCVIMAGCFDGLSVVSQVMSYEGPFGVGYGICGFYPGEPDEGRKYEKKYIEWENADKKSRRDSEDAYVSLARRTLESYIRTGEVDKDIISGVPAELLHNRAGVFVSLKKHGDLRGCIGTISSTQKNIAMEIIVNAVSSGTRDGRFSPVTEDELNELVYSVDVLGDAEEIDSRDMLDVKRYGVIVTSGNKRGLLLPNLYGVDSVGEQISIALKKGGIKESEPYRMERFEVVRHC